MMKTSLEIGDIITEEEFKELSRFARSVSFNGKTYMLKDDYEFKRFQIKLDEYSYENRYEVVSTFKSRIEESDTNHAAIHRPERKLYKGYYNNKS